MKLAIKASLFKTIIFVPWFTWQTIALANVEQPEISQLFDRTGIKMVTPAGKFPRWEDMLKRWSITNGLTPNDCKPGFFNYCQYNELVSLANELTKTEPYIQLQKIHHFVNRIRYMNDFRLYGKTDYWAIPQEFFEHAMGDCEDYSITKYYVLKKLGFPVQNLRIVIVKDINLDIYHAVLAVRNQDEEYILDNRLLAVAKSQDLNHYQPIYAINEENWWLYD